MEKVLEGSRAALSAIVMAYMACIMAAIEDSTKTLRLFGKMNAAIHRHQKIQDKIYAQVLREKLASHAGYRRQVRSDLGKGGALLRWRNRQRQGQSSASANTAYANTPQVVIDRIAREKLRTRTTPRARWQPRTSRDGCFRLATIPAGPREHYARAEAPRRKVRRVTEYVFKPIEVSAEDLRDHRYDIDYWGPPAPASRNLPSGASPPINHFPD